MTRDQKAAADARAIDKAAASIIAVYLDAPALTRGAGHRWYSEEHARCADLAARTGRTVEAIAGAAAAISPGMRWDSVFGHVRALIDNPGHRGVPTYCHEFVKRAQRCLAGEDPAAVLGGPKVTAFYRLLAALDDYAVVVDGHAWNICLMEPWVFRARPDYPMPPAARINARRYRIAAAAYRQVAVDVGRPAHQIQAATWLHWRNVLTPF